MHRFQRILVFFVFLILFTVIYDFGTMNEVEKTDAEKFIEDFNEIIHKIDSIGIFLHNLAIALPMFIPGVGILWGFFSSWSTGYAFAALESIKPSLSSIDPLKLLYFTPFGLLELTAYSIAMSRSFLLMYKIIKKVSLKHDLVIIFIEIIITTVLLLLGGLVEDYMLMSLSDIDL